MIKAAIDVGTNSVRLLVAKTIEGTWHTLVKEVETTRLGEGVHASRKLKPAAMQRTIAAVDSFAAKAKQLGAEQVLAVATSAVRDAVNGLEFVRLCQEQTGITLEILDGEAEARLSYAGAVTDWSEAGQCMVIDIGGGSTEVIVGIGNYLTSAQSFNIGAVRLSELFPADEQGKVNCLPQLREYIARQLNFPTGFKGILIGVGGTITSLAAIDQGLREYSRELVHDYKLSAAQIDRWLQHLAAMPLVERRQIAGLQPQRADIIVYGTAILSVCLQRLAAPHITVSEKDILEGVLLFR